MRIALTETPIVEKQPCTMHLREEMNVWETGPALRWRKREPHQKRLL